MIESYLGDIHMKRFNKILGIALAFISVSALAGCNIGDIADPPTTSTTSTTTTVTTTTNASDATTVNSQKSTTGATTQIKTTKTASPTKKQEKVTTADTYLYAYAGFNPVETDMTVPFNEILLNRNYRLPDGYTPKLAVAVEGSSEKLDYRVAPFYQKMYDAALLDGIKLTPVSGYRSVARQKRNFENRIAMYQKQGLNKTDATVKASHIVLLPQTSEHNAGLAMDICSLSVSFEKTKEFQWLQAHAHEYGFIMRYPKDKISITKITYEPWHYRYVGVELANKLKESGMVLEEYLDKA